MGEILGFYQKGFEHRDSQRCVLRVRRFPAQRTMYLEAEIPVEKLLMRDTRQWVESNEYFLREMFAPFEGSLVSVDIDDSVVYIHIYLDDELDDDEITDNGICLKKFLEQEKHIKIDDDYVTGDESPVGQNR